MSFFLVGTIPLLYFRTSKSQCVYNIFKIRFLFYLKRPMYQRTCLRRLSILVFLMPTSSRKKRTFFTTVSNKLLSFSQKIPRYSFLLARINNARLVHTSTILESALCFSPNIFAAFRIFMHGGVESPPCPKRGVESQSCAQKWGDGISRDGEGEVASFHREGEG